MKINDTMHPAQVAILHALLFRPSAAFAELQKASALSSDHFNFHLKKMIEQKLVKKSADGHYTLTIAGKEYANRFDTDARVVERQPKVAVPASNRKPGGEVALPATSQTAVLWILGSSHRKNPLWRNNPRWRSTRVNGRNQPYGDTGIQGRIS